MTLETLAKDIAKSAEAEASAMLKSAQDDAKAILAEANSKADSIRSEASARTEREAAQIAREVVASARQANQKEILVARRKVLDETLESASNELGSPNMSGRASLLKSLMAKADKIGGNDYSIRPVELDRKALSELAGKRKVGEAIEGLGGFVLESPDGSVSYDMRFDTLLESSWNDQLAEINSILFD
jgi:V/A-type H+-transporting ATPase subunit E